MMPLYEFVNEHHGLKVDLVFPVDDRPDEIVLRRNRVPSRVTVGVGAKPTTTGQELLNDYKKLEERGNLDQRPGRFTAEQVKEAALLPDVEG